MLIGVFEGAELKSGLYFELQLLLDCVLATLSKTLVKFCKKWGVEFRKIYPRIHNDNICSTPLVVFVVQISEITGTQQKDAKKV